MSLSDAKIRRIKPSVKPFQLIDSQGLYLLVNTGGPRLWYLIYRFTGKMLWSCRAELAQN